MKSSSGLSGRAFVFHALSDALLHDEIFVMLIFIINHDLNFKEMKELTKFIHTLQEDPLTGAISTPIYQTSTFVQDAPGVNKGFDYARSNNPTRAQLEKLVAELEEGYAGFAFASGLAAIDGVLKLLNTGDEILAVEDIYGGSFRIFEHIYRKFGINIRYVDTTDAENVLYNISNKTKLVWLETPTNPTLKISDIKAIGDIAHQFGAYLVVDNTFCSPCLQKPIKLGADIVVHSATKYLAGHSDVIAGIVVVNNEELASQLKFNQNSSGGILGPFDSWLTIRGIQTLPLRIKQQSDSAQQIAEFLEAHDLVDKVYYPGLGSHKNHHIAKQQQSGYGAMISFSFKEDTIRNARQFVCSTNYFKLAESLGGLKSLICHPASMTHKSTPREIKLKAGVQDSLVRLSCGIEDVRDLINDLEQSFELVRAQYKVRAVAYSK